MLRVFPIIYSKKIIILNYTTYSIVVKVEFAITLVQIMGIISVQASLSRKHPKKYLGRPSQKALKSLAQKKRRLDCPCWKSQDAGEMADGHIFSRQRIMMSLAGMMSLSPSGRVRKRNRAASVRDAKSGKSAR
jgi:hypothetical protein